MNKLQLIIFWNLPLDFGINLTAAIKTLWWRLSFKRNCQVTGKIKTAPLKSIETQNKVIANCEVVLIIYYSDIASARFKSGGIPEICKKINALRGGARGFRSPQMLCIIWVLHSMDEKDSHLRSMAVGTGRGAHANEDTFPCKINGSLDGWNID